MNATHEGLVKCDRRGRLRYAPGQRQALLEAYTASGLSGPKFAALHGVKYQTLAFWLQKRKREGGFAALPSPAGLALVEIEAPSRLPGDGGLLLDLPGGITLRVADQISVPLAAALIRALSAPC
jgi:hypothetical protein